MNELHLNEANLNSANTDDLRASIEALSQALMDHKNDTDNTLNEILRKGKDSTNYVPVMNQSPNYISDYITKSSNNFPVIGGYSVLPGISINDMPSKTKSLLRMTNVIKQTNGLEHEIISIPPTAFVNLKNETINTIVEPRKIKLKMHPIEFGIFLESEMIANKAPVNFKSVIQNTLHDHFINEENKLMISDNGVDESIQGIGKLNGSGFTTLNIEYSKVESELYNVLLQMTALLPQEYLDGSVWLMSPRIWAAICGMRDKNGQFILNQNNTLSLLGKPIYCHPNFDQTTNHIILSNLRYGYTLVENPNILALQDKYTDRRGVRNYFKRLVCGTITDPNAWVSLNISELPSDNFIRF